ncbi:TlpA family protein disulfide reductase [Bacteroidota bacterium]
MKMLIKTLGVFLLSILLFASCINDEDELKTDRIVVEGKILNYDQLKTTFSYDKYELLSSTRTAEVLFEPDGSYKMILKSDKALRGYFSFGKEAITYKFDIIQVNGRDSSLSVESFDFKMLYLYLEPGDSIIMNLDYNIITSSISFTGKGANNNIFINKEENEYNSYKHKYLRNYYNITYRQPLDYKRIVNQLRDEKLEFIDNFSKSKKLSTHLHEIYTADCHNDAISSKMNYPESHKSFNDGKPVILPEDYFNFLNDAVLFDEIGDKGIGHYYFLKSWLGKKYELNSSEWEDFYDYVKSQFEGRLFYEFLALSLNRDFKKSLYDYFNENCPYPDIASLVKEKYKHLEGMLEGNPAPDFSLAEVDGNIVSLQDLRGKYVYIDFWATWCGPCIKEIPGLKKLEEKYKEGNITFLSISFDKESDKKKWKNYVIDNNLSGIQLIADKASNELLSTAFNIEMIPRFILLDPNGNIVDSNAPRPSDNRLIKLFNDNGIKN